MKVIRQKDFKAFMEKHAHNWCEIPYEDFPEVIDLGAAMKEALTDYQPVLHVEGITTTT
jgi:hypothetical protein